jgi:TPR repeat protein
MQDLACVGGILVDGNWLYWLEADFDDQSRFQPGTIKRRSLSDGSVTVLADGIKGSGSFTVSDGTLYYTHFGTWHYEANKRWYDADGGVYRIALPPEPTPAHAKAKQEPKPEAKPEAKPAPTAAQVPPSGQEARPAVDIPPCTKDCGTLSWNYHEGIGVPRDYTKAFALARRGCDAGEFSSQPCQILGWYYEAGDGVAKDMAVAISYYNRGCDHDEPWGCAHLGWSYFNGTGVGKDMSAAAGYFKRSCDRASVGCGTLSWMHHEGDGATRDYAQAVMLAKRGCDAAEHVSQPCQVLGYYYEVGHGVAIDHSRALSLYQQSCAAGESWGCAHLGWAYENAVGTTKDPIQAKANLAKACRLGITTVCTR